MFGILLALGSAITYGIGDYCGGRSTRSASVMSVMLNAQLCGVILLLVALPLIGDPVAPMRDWLIGGSAGLAGTVGLGCFYSAMSGGNMSVIAPVTAVVSLVVPVLWGTVVRGEDVAGIALVGIILAVCSIALVSGAGSRTGFHVSRATLGLAVIGGIGFGSMFIALGETGSESGLWSLVAARIVTVGVVVAIVVIRGIPRLVPRTIAPIVVLGGLLDMSANILYLLSTRHGLIAVMATISSLYPASTVALAVAIDRERLSRTQAVGLGCAVAALVLVSLGR